MADMQESCNQGQRAPENEPLQVLTFSTSGMVCGVDINNVQEIHEMVDIARVGHAPAYVEGVINLLDRVIPVIDLQIRLGIGNAAHRKASRIIVAEVRSTLVGFIVDSVIEVLSISAYDLRPPAPGSGRIGIEFVAAFAEVENRLITVLDLERVLVPDDTAIPGLKI
jgi:purine-binding chemotaxis protein CheW